MVLENTRFEDVPNKLESGNDTQLAMYWAGLADIYCLDAFGSAHRKHASTYGVANYLPSCIGFLVQKEVEMLEAALPAFAFKRAMRDLGLCGAWKALDKINVGLH
jgi:phosphoglycerate kinase